MKGEGALKVSTLWVDHKMTAESHTNTHTGRGVDAGRIEETDGEVSTDNAEQ